jgi:hypothetical protein
VLHYSLSLGSITCLGLENLFTLVLVGVFFITAVFLSSFSNLDNLSLLFLPLNLRFLLQKYADFRQNLYNKITLKLLETPLINVIVKLWHRFLFAFRIYSVNICDYISQYISMNMLALIISIVFSRLHIAGYLIIFCLLFLRLDFGVLAMARFYKKYPDKLHNLYTNQKRFMWSQVGKIAQEAASNPYVVTTATAVVGCVGWKALDVWEIHKESLMQDKDIAAENKRHAENIAAENQRHAEEMSMRRAELEEARLTRMDENRRHAEELAQKNTEN